MIKEDVTKSFYFGAKVRFIKTVHQSLQNKDFCLVGFQDNAFALIEWHLRGQYHFDYYSGSVYSDLELVED
jgi:hypothetical protein